MPKPPQPDQALDSNFPAISEKLSWSWGTWIWASLKVSNFDVEKNPWPQQAILEELCSQNSLT